MGIPHVFWLRNMDCVIIFAFVPLIHPLTIVGRAELQTNTLTYTK